MFCPSEDGESLVFSAPTVVKARILVTFKMGIDEYLKAGLWNGQRGGCEATEDQSWNGGAGQRGRFPLL